MRRGMVSHIVSWRLLHAERQRDCLSGPGSRTALVELAVMLAVVAAYVVVARRHRVLWHPLSIVLAVGIVGIVVAVLGELFRGGWSGVPTMLRRSAIGGFGWGVIIAIVVWIVRRLFVSRTKHTDRSVSDAL